MDEEMNAAEIVERLAKEKGETDRTLLILKILDECKTLEEAKEKVKALLNKN